MPKSKAVEQLSLVERFSQLTETITPIDDIDMPRLPSLELLGNRAEPYAKEFLEEMHNTTVLTVSLHWRWAQLIFWWDFGRLWETEEAGGCSSLSDWLEQNVDWLPLSRAQLTKLKRLWQIYFYWIKVDQDPELLGLVLSIGNADKLAEIAAHVNKQNIRDWLLWINQEKPSMLEVQTVSREAKQMMREDEDLPKAEILPEVIVPVVEFPEPPSKEVNEYDRLERSGIGKGWWGRLTAKDKVRVRRTEYPTKTVIEIIKLLRG